MKDVISPRRPWPVLVLGVLHLLFGALGLLTALVASLIPHLFVQVFLAREQGANRDLQLLVMENLATLPAMQFYILGPFLSSGMLAGVVVPFVICLFQDCMLLGGGIGLLRMRPWGPRLSLAYALLSIANHLFILVWGMLVLRPVARHIFEDMIISQYNGVTSGALAEEVFVLRLVLATVVSLIYPALVLVVLLDRQVRAAFRHAAGPPAGIGPAAATSV